MKIVKKIFVAAFVISALFPMANVALSSPVEIPINLNQKISDVSPDTLYFRPFRIETIAWSDDGSKLAVGVTSGIDTVSRVSGTVQIFDMTTTSPTLIATLPETGWVVSIDFHPDGIHLAVLAARKARIYNITSPKQPLLVADKAETNSEIKFNDDGTQLTVGVHLRKANIYDIDFDTVGGELKVVLHGSLGRETGPIGNLAFEHSGLQMAATARDEIGIYDPRVSPALCGRNANHKEVAICRMFTLMSGVGGFSTSLTYNNDDTELANAANNKIGFYKIPFNTTDGEKVNPQETIVMPSVVRSLSYDRKGTHLAVGEVNGKLSIFNRLNTGTLPQTFSEARKRINSVKYNPEGDFLAAGGDDQTLRIYNVN